MSVLKIEWLLNRSCNLRCEYCKIIDKSSLKGRVLTGEEVMEGVRALSVRFPKVPIIFFGGEPTVTSYLPELVRMCEDYEIKYAVISNSARVVEDNTYFFALVAAGISNWSASVDTLKGLEDSDIHKKSNYGLQALIKFREVGVRDLVACITVTKNNIDELPEIIEGLTKEGIWSITTPLQVGDDTFEYSGTSRDLQCTDTDKIKSMARTLKEMALSGKYLMHNAPEFYDLWEHYFVAQDWKCKGKYNLTIDADGSFKRCVDKKGGLNHFNVKDILDNDMWYEYLEAVAQPHECKGCFWDPAVETMLRGESWSEDDAVDSFRHDLTPERISKLLPEAQRWFNETVKD